MSSFDFVSNDVLRSNLNFAFSHIVDLLALSESESYKDNQAFVSSLRKTIYIYTASIIEALLLWKLEMKSNSHEVELKDEWNYKNVKLLYTINGSEEVVGVIRKKVKKNLNKLDFLRITDVCFDSGIIKSNILRKNIDKVRIVRNRLHIGGLSEVEKIYTKKDLEFCFKIAGKVKALAQRSS